MSRILIATSVLLLLSACQDGSRTQDPAAAVSAAPAATEVVDAVAAVSGPMLNLEPARLDQCNPAVEAVARWKLTDRPELAKLELRTGSGKLFAAGGRSGEARTGKWARPGTRLLLVDPASGETLAEAVIGGPVCR